MRAWAIPTSGPVASGPAAAAGTAPPGTAGCSACADAPEHTHRAQRPERRPEHHRRPNHGSPHDRAARTWAQPTTHRTGHSQPPGTGTGNADIARTVPRTPKSCHWGHRRRLPARQARPPPPVRPSVPSSTTAAAGCRLGRQVEEPEPPRDGWSTETTERWSDASTKEAPEELGERAIRLGLDLVDAPQQPSVNAPCKRVGRATGIVPDSLRNWVQQDRIDAGSPVAATTEQPTTPDIRTDVPERGLISAAARVPTPPTGSR